MRHLQPILVCLVLSLFAQTASASWGTLRIPARFRSWTLKHASGDETTIRQSYVPVTLIKSMGSKGHLILSTTGASSNVAHRGTESFQGSDQGLTAQSDLMVQTVYRLSGSLLIQGGVNLPAGKTKLSLDEFFIVRRISHPLFGFPLRQYGQGWDFSGGVAWASTLSEGWETGLGVGAIYHGDYQLLAGVYEKYRPGYEIAVSGGLTAGVQKSSMLNADVTYRFFGEDQVEGITAYQQGAQLETNLAFHTSLGPSWFAHVSARGVFKRDSEIPIEDSLETLLTAPGNSLMAGLELSRRISPRTTLGLAVDMRGYNGSQTTRQDGTVLALGPSFTFRTRTAGTWEIVPQYMTGTLQENDFAEETDLSGWSISVTYQLQSQ